MKRYGWKYWTGIFLCAFVFDFVYEWLTHGAGQYGLAVLMVGAAVGFLVVLPKGAE